MSEFSWGPEVVEETRPGQQPESPAAGSETLAVSADDFSALEERILRAVNLVKRERMERAAAEERALAAEARISEQVEIADSLRKESETQQKEIDTLRGEREQVRQRVEKLLSQLDELGE